MKSDNIPTTAEEEVPKTNSPVAKYVANSIFFNNKAYLLHYLFFIYLYIKKRNNPGGSITSQ
jgi:hypothetical protein